MEMIPKSLAYTRMVPFIKENSRGKRSGLFQEILLGICHRPGHRVFPLKVSI